MATINTTQGMCQLEIQSVIKTCCSLSLCEIQFGREHRTDSIMTDTELAHAGAPPMQRKDQDALSNQELQSL